MRFVLSTIGSRGDVQPLVALGLALRSLGADVHLVVPPDFCEWIEGMGMRVTPIGPELRATAKPASPAPAITPDQRRSLIEGTVGAQFATLFAVARGCDAMVGATTLQVAAPSIAESLGIPYVFAAYCPAVLPSPHHPPPVLAMLGDKPAAERTDYSALWESDTARWNATWQDIVNAKRKTLALAPIDDVRAHVLTPRPWLAADNALAPWPSPNDGSVVQTGAWIMEDSRPLPPEVERFLDAGERPVYFGFGSVRTPEGINRSFVEAARACGRRCVLLRGWSDVTSIDGADDTLSLGEVNQQALFRRVAAVVHHGGAGTTTAAARAGAPQVVIPQHYDQHYWAGRVEQLSLGVTHVSTDPTPESLALAVTKCLQSAAGSNARTFAARMQSDGAMVAARKLLGD